MTDLADTAASVAGTALGSTISAATKPLRWQIYGALLLAGAGALGAAVWWHAGRVQATHQAAYDKARGEQVRAENRALLVQQERIAALSTQLMEAQSAHTKTQASLATARAAAGQRGERVRSAAGGDELGLRLGAADCTVARGFAADAFRTATACRDAVAEIGLGSGGLVESAASAHYEHERADALMRFSMPLSPFSNPTTTTPE